MQILHPGAEKYLLYGGKALFQVGNDIVNVLCADRETDGVLLNALIQQLLRSEL